MTDIIERLKAYFVEGADGCCYSPPICDEAAAEIEALRKDAARYRWQPIETAPMDTLILLYVAKRSEMVVGMKHSRDGWVIDTPSEWASMYPPKRWMPLPDPPAMEKP